MTIEEILNKNVFDTLDTTGVSEEEKKRFLEEATQLILVRVVERIEKELEPNLKEEFIALFTQEPSEDRRTRFLEQHVPDFEAILLEEVLLFKDKAMNKGL